MRINPANIQQFLRINPDRTNAVSFVLTALVLCYLMISVSLNADSPGERMVVVRYLNFVFCGFFAFIIPHVRFPDRKRYLIQAINLSPDQLYSYSARALTPVFALFTLMLLILTFGDLRNPFTDLQSKAVTFLSGWTLMTGIGIMAAVRYTTIGSVSQEWQEGTRGSGFMNTMRNVGQSPSVPTGSFPSLLTTVYIAAGGMMLVVAGAYLSGVTGNPVLEMVPGLLILAYAGIRALSIRKLFDRYFYHTNAFYAELFLNPKAVQEGREPIRHDALYWVPSRWKPAAWFSLLQLDRRQPLGRLLLTGHIILWTLFYAGLGDAVISSFITLLVLGKSLMVYMLISKPFAPLLFQYRLLKPTDWIIVRFFVNLRWLPLLVISLWIVSLLSNRVDGNFILQWALIDAGISLLSAMIFTFLHEFRLKKLYA